MTSCSRPNRRAQRGMTLIEVLVSILILSFGLLGLVGLQSRATAISSGAEDSNKAALLGNEIVTALVMNPVSSPASGGTFDMSSASAAASAASTAASQVPNGTATITFDATAKLATVVISWKPPSAASTAAPNNYTTQAVLP